MACSVIAGAAGGPVGDHLLSLYRRLLDAFGPQEWWPGETPFEVCVGAILTQNTNWENVERAVSRLRNEGLLNPLPLHELPAVALAELIRSAGYYNIKAARLKSFVAFLVEEFRGDLDAMFSLGREALRPRLLDVKGIGPETADSILLYAGGLPTFVVDAYTIRALLRHDIISEDAGYEDVRSLFMDHLPEDIPLYNEFHALWVALGKGRCKRGRPKCRGCPLEGA
jgi:endonuclease-3 related protein